ncbi:hypothetical protein GCM10011309_12750 [Litorimonas cladophorae]|uniref:Uncharacterized protein n=1 Tax=Litorimonas cladophorae TaxID=1220491 RepID=A0A918KK16_9PROT|nr:hypothetical protein [Litorimonas cladophorae]GGX64140.1 hypothetical protein GCM10011309_12750 [Litorimonas cladophorae]
MKKEKIGVPPELTELKARLAEHRLAQYIRLNGGVPIPMAGAIYWLALAYVGTRTGLEGWAGLALPLSGAIFPLALLLAALMKNKFMSDKSAVGDVLLPTFIGMLLFWPMLVMAIKSASPELVVPILAIGMSIHWPVIGWSYNRTALFSAHSILRAGLTLLVWFTAREQILILIPLAVAATYILTIAAIYFDVARLKSKSLTPLSGALS